MPFDPDALRARAQFAEMLRERVRAQPAVAFCRVSAGDLTLELTLHDGSSGAVSLRVAFADWSGAAPAERNAVLAKHAAAIVRARVSAGREWQAARLRLRSVLRPSTFEMNTPYLRRPVLPFIDECVALVDDERTTFVTPASVERWGVPWSDVFAAARSGVANASRSAFRAHADGIWARGGREAAGGVLSAASLDAPHEGVRHPLVVAVPTWDCIFVAYGDDPPRVTRLAKMASREYEHGARPLSPALYTLDEVGDAVRYRRPGSDRAARTVVRGHVRLACAEYDLQRGVLDAELAAAGEDTRVAPCLVGRRDGVLVSYCVWRAGESVLLPEVDEVVCAASNGRELCFAVGWGDAARVAADAFEPYAYGGPPLMFAPSGCLDVLAHDLFGVRLPGLPRRMPERPVPATRGPRVGGSGPAAGWPRS
jgi:hypothetical protein